MSNTNSKVLWIEGMTLDPHHFQQSDRFHTRQLDVRIKALTPNAWGFSNLVIDEDRLANGDFSVSACAGIMPEGFVFRLPDEEPLPASRPIGDFFEASATALNVYLCLPYMTGGPNLGPKGSATQLSRFHNDSISISDENTGFDERAVEVARPNFEIRFENENLSGYTTIQITRIVRSAGGYYERDSRFIPSSLTLEASQNLFATASRMMELTLAKSAELNTRRSATTSQRQLTPADVSAIGLLAAVNSHIPLLRNQLSGPGCHPEKLYDTILSLAGHLTAYSPDTSLNPGDFPLYDHSDLSTCVNRMSEIIASILGGAKPSAHYRRLTLSTVRQNLYQTEITQDELTQADIILSVKSPNIDEARIINELPAMIRIAAPEMIEQVLRSYTRAIAITHTSRLPVGMPEDPMCSYFKIERSGPFWDGIVQSKKLSLFVPAEFGDMQLELIAIMRG